MKFKNLLYAFAFGAVTFGFASCSDDHNSDSEPSVPTTVGYYILNRGNYNKNNANLAYYDVADKKLITDYYKKQNNVDLGSDAQQIFQYGSKLYISVTTSNNIVVTDLEGNKLGEASPKNAQGQPVGPRCFTAMNGKVYVSYFSGSAIGIMDTTSLSITGTIDLGTTAAGGSRYPEELAVANGNIYVALSEYGKGNKVGVINPTSQKIEKEIEVTINPVSLSTGKNGDVYSISMGNYGDIKNTLEVIHKNGSVEKLGNGSRMTVVGDYLYVVYAQYGDPAPTFSKYSTSDNKLVSDKLISDASLLTNPNSIDVDPVSEDIYISNAPYGSTADIYVYDKEGKQVGTPFGTGGYDTQKVLFIIDNK